MRLVLSIFALALYLLPKVSQAQEYEDLLALYIDEKYEKLFQKAYNYTQNDKHKKHPLPYIYASISKFEMSNDMSFREDHPRAQSEALKFAEKFRKKDKELQYWDEYQDYISELRKSVIEVAENHLDAAKTMKKGHKIYRSLTKIDPEDGVAWLMRGYCEEVMLNAPEAKISLEEKAWPLLNKMTSTDDFTDEQLYLLKFGLMTYARYLVDNERQLDAEKAMEYGEKFFAEDEVYKETMAEIKG